MAHDDESVAEAFETALSMDPDSRGSFLRELAEHDPLLRNELEELLEGHALTNGFLEIPILRCSSDEAQLSVSEDLFEGRLKAGDLLNHRFRIVRYLASGGMGEVYEAQDLLLQSTPIALKVLHPHIANDRSSRRRFEQEVLTARQIIHPNLCPIYDLFYADSPFPRLSFLTMKLLAGKSLAEKLSGRRPLPPEEAQRVQTQLIAAIAAIHEAGVVHRDIKPSNVILQGSGPAAHLWITDFGLARTFEGDASQMTQSLVAGTLGYMSPEILAGERPSQASDIFALGIVLHQVFTGDKPAFRANGLPIIHSSRWKHAGNAAALQRVAEFLSEDPERRCQAFKQAQNLFAPARRFYSLPARGLWSRRSLLQAGAAAAVLTTGAALTRDRWSDWLAPLPVKRFVALIVWPPAADERTNAMLVGVVDGIEQELSRAEAFDRNLYVIAPKHLPGTQSPLKLADLRESLGTNLVLAASGVSHANGFDVSLSVLDPMNESSLRQQSLRCGFGKEMALVQDAVHVAARLLDVSRGIGSGGADSPVTTSSAAYEAFQMAEAQRKRENDASLDDAIVSYKRALDIDPRFALAYARLARAYCRSYEVQRNPASLQLARRNYEAAINYSPKLVEAYLAKAAYEQMIFDTKNALKTLDKVLLFDSSNAEAILKIASTHDIQNQWIEAERYLTLALKLRPNYWTIYNELGVVYSEQAKFSHALEAFQIAHAAAPKNSLSLNNIASTYLTLGNIALAKDACTRSLAVHLNALAATTMAAALRLQGRPMEATSFARQSVAMDAGDGSCWIELGDCYEKLGSHEQESQQAYSEGVKAQSALLETSASDGPSWMLMGLCKAKAKSPGALLAIHKADTLPSGDIDTQIYKARALAALGMQKESLSVLQLCIRRGATKYQIQLSPELTAIRHLIATPSSLNEVQT